MILLALALHAHADPARPLARVDEALTERRWWTVDGVEVGPARPKWRNRRGLWRCWTFPDGIASRCIESDKRGDLVSERRFDASGAPATTRTGSADAPEQVTVHGVEDVVVDVSSASPSPLADLVVRGPGEPVQDSDGVLSWTLDQGTLSARVVPRADTDVLGDPFGEALFASCACILEDRTTTWLHGQLGVRYRLRHPDPDRPFVSELWALPRGDQVVLLAFRTFGQPRDARDDGPAARLQAVQSRLAHGRAWVALTTVAEDGGSP